MEIPRELLAPLQPLLSNRLQSESRRAVSEAWERASAALPDAEDDPLSAALRHTLFAADVLSALILEDGWAPEHARALVRAIARSADRPPRRMALAVFLRAVRDPRHHELPPQLGATAILRLLLALAPLSEASIWARPDAFSVTSCLVYVGTGKPTPRARSLAQALLDDDAPAAAGARSLLHAVPILRWQRPFGALVVRGRSEDRLTRAPYLEEASAALGPVLEKDSLLARNLAKERALLESSERRLARLGFDLHDGAMQELLLLASDLRLLRTQLEGELDGHERRQVLLGRLDDLDARLRSVEDELRLLVRSIEAPEAFRSPFKALLETDIDAFSSRTGIAATLAADGDLERLGRNEREALRRVVQEALANVREHSGASSVHVVLHLRRDTVVAEVTDDGRGFDVQQTLERAAERGRLGLTGMMERLRLLGGTLTLTSRPGGPTTVGATLPRWTPLAGRSAAKEAA